MGNKITQLVLLCTLMLLLLLQWATLSLGDSAVGEYVPYHSPQVAPYLHKDQAPVELRDSNLKKVYEVIYPYYQRPRYRYPFYDVYGNGELLYGYGGSRLFRYTVFKPVEGYLRRR
ncbi:uncharacterized protein LOC143032435 [Oratosquilla oratoria]|uniref:uncharacterized protein LOC143032435 n=1 Tax=Oratosquilla oratoria TaxID=337810 RepID=UPI003F76B259